ncbi:MAG: FAD-dependent oxidoreductase [Bacteroidota bacterium]
MSPNYYDAIIIGAGVSGLTCALELTRTGKNILVLENSKYPFFKSSFHHEMLSYEAKRNLEKMVELNSDLDIKKTRIERIVSRWKKEEIMVKNLDPLIYPVSVNKQLLVQKMRNQCQRESIRVNYQNRVLKIQTRKENCIQIETVHNNKKRISLCKHLIIATGRTSRNPVTNENYQPQYISCGFELPLRDSAFRNDFFLESNAYCKNWIYGLPNSFDMFYINISIPVKILKGCKNRIPLLRKVLQESILMKEVVKEENIDKVQYYWGGSYQWDQNFDNNIVCIGDAAYVHNPLSGRGSEFAIDSAQKVAELINYGKSADGFEFYKEHIYKYIQNQKKHEDYWLN